MAQGTNGTAQNESAVAKGDPISHDADRLIKHILSSESYYDILQIEKDAYSVEGVRTQYIKMSRLIHPDKHGDKPQATIAFQKLYKAYETLRHPHSQRLYNLRGQGIGLGKDDALATLIKHIYKEFHEGEFQTLLEFVDRINAEHPELHIERSMAERVLLDTCNLIEDVDKLLAELHRDLSGALESYRHMRTMSYLDVGGRISCGAEITVLLLCMPLRVIRVVPMPRIVASSWDGLVAMHRSIAVSVCSLPRRTVLAIYVDLWQLWTVVLGLLERWIAWCLLSGPIDRGRAESPSPN